MAPAAVQQTVAHVCVSAAAAGPCKPAIPAGFVPRHGQSRLEEQQHQCSPLRTPAHCLPRLVRHGKKACACCCAAAVVYPTPNSTDPTLSSESMSGMGEAGAEVRLSWTAVSLLLCSRALMLRPRPRPGLLATQHCTCWGCGSRHIGVALGEGCALGHWSSLAGKVLSGKGNHCSIHCQMSNYIQVPVRQPQEVRISRKVPTTCGQMYHMLTADFAVATGTSTNLRMCQQAATASKSG